MKLTIWNILGARADLLQDISDRPGVLRPHVLIILGLGGLPEVPVLPSSEIDDLEHLGAPGRFAPRYIRSTWGASPACSNYSVGGRFARFSSSAE